MLWSPIRESASSWCLTTLMTRITWTVNRATQGMTRTPTVRCWTSPMVTPTAAVRPCPRLWQPLPGWWSWGTGSTILATGWRWEPHSPTALREESAPQLLYSVMNFHTKLVSSFYTVPGAMFYFFYSLVKVFRSHKITGICSQKVDDILIKKQFSSSLFIEFKMLVTGGEEQNMTVELCNWLTPMFTHWLFAIVWKNLVIIVCGV